VGSHNGVVGEKRVSKGRGENLISNWTDFLSEGRKGPEKGGGTREPRAYKNENSWAEESLEERMWAPTLQGNVEDG